MWHTVCVCVAMSVPVCWRVDVSSCDKIRICLDPLTQKDCQHRHSPGYKYHQSHLLHLLVPPCNATLFGFSSVALQLRAVALARLFWLYLSDAVKDLHCSFIDINCSLCTFVHSVTLFKFKHSCLFLYDVKTCLAWLATKWIKEKLRTV